MVPKKTMEHSRFSTNVCWVLKIQEGSILKDNSYVEKSDSRPWKTSQNASLFKKFYFIVYIFYIYKYLCLYIHICIYKYIHIYMSVCVYFFTSLYSPGVLPPKYHLWTIILIFCAYPFPDFSLPSSPSLVVCFYIDLWMRKRNARNLIVA